MQPIIDQIGAVVREVTSREHEGKKAWVIVASRPFAAGIEEVWDAITNAERIPRWFLPVTGDLEPGGRYQLEGNASGVIERCEPPRHLALTWEFAGKISWVNAELTAASDSETLLRLEHIAHEDEHWEQFGAGAGGIGWDLSLLGLHLYLTSDWETSAEKSMEFFGSEEGLGFMLASNDAWCQAAIAGGIDEAEARGAAARTLAAYTGESAG